MKRLFVFLTGLALLSAVQMTQAVTDTFTASTTWTAPAGVTSVDVEVWGGGGAGGGNPTNRDGGGGGGGGAYSKTTAIPVVPGTVYTVTVGVGGVGGTGVGGNGGDSWFSTIGTILAKGGTGGADPVAGAGGVAGIGGAAAAGIGTIKFSGGNGGTGRDSNAGRGGPGGSSAGTAAVGTSGPVLWATAIAAAPPAGGGIGGDGGNANSASGLVPASGNGGGGGGGAEQNTLGGNGAPGKVAITYTPPPAVVSINTAGANPSNAASVSWTVMFNASVTGVAAGNFTLANSGLGGTPAITGVSGSGTTWTVTASTGTGTGTLGLNMTNTTGITPALAGLPFTGQVYSVRPPAPVTYFHDTTLGVNIGFDGLTNVTGANQVIPPIVTASLNPVSTCPVTRARSNSHPIGLYTHSRWYLNANYAVATNIGANPNGSASLRGGAVTDTVIVNLYDYDPVSGAKVLIGSSAPITLTGGGATTTYTYIITSPLYTVPAGHRLMLQYDFNQPVATYNARVYCDAVASYISVVETSAPSVSSIIPASANPTNPNTSVDWTVTFDRNVTGVDTADFALALGGSVTGAYITGVTGSGTTWTVTANTGSGTGTLGLNLVDDDSIVDGGGQPLGGVGAGNGNFTGQVYTVETPMTCITDDFATGVLDTGLWNVMAVSGPFTPQVVNVGGGDFRLRLTDTGANEATFAQLKPTFPGAGNKIVLEIDYFAYGGTGADGVAVTFSDSAISSTTGGFGGSLGYANRTGIDGFGGGWLGIGLDEYGNFPNPTEGRTGYPVGWVAPAPANVAAGFYKTNVSVRGSGSAQTGYSLLANTGVLATAVNPPGGAAGATPYRYRFTIDHSNGTNAWVTVERDTTATGASYQVLVPTFDVKAANSGQAAVPPSWLVSFTGSTGGSTNFHEFKRVRVCANTIVASGPDHLEIQHPSGTEVTCNPSTLTIKACADALVPCTPYTGGVTGTLSATGTPTVNWDGTTGGAAGAGFDIPVGSSTVTKNVQVTTVGTTVFDAAAAPAATNTTTCNFGTPACTFTATDSAFVVTAPNHVAETVSTLTIQAVKSVPGNPLLCTAGMTGAKTVNLKCSYTNPASGTLPVRIGGTPLAADAVSACSAGGVDVPLTFDASGVATPTLQYADVGNMLISASFTGTPGSIDAGLVLNGSDNFIAAPAAFDFSAFTVGTIKAGDPFSATVRALNAAGAVTPNFGKESEGVTLTSTLITPDPVTYPTASNPALGNNAIPGAEFGASGMVSDANGVASVNNLSWGEVGSITLTANLASGSYLGSGLTATGTSATVGPFIPHHFDTVVVATANLPMPCPAGLTCPALYDGFVYSGQPFSVQVFARNLAGSTTTNYDGAFGLSKPVTLEAWDAKGGATQNPGSGVPGSNAVAATAFTSGVATLTDTLTYTFGVSPTSPTDIYVRAVENGGGVTSLRTTPADSVEGGVKVVSGRVKIGNAHGSELLDLPMSATVQYYDGTSWLTSIADSVTSLALGLSNYQRKTGGSWTTTTTPTSGQIIAGVLTFNLSKPIGGGTGSVDVSITAPDYLLAGSNGAAINPSITGRATFGVYKGNNEFIYLRESY